MKFTIDTDEIKARGTPMDVFVHLLGLYLGASGSGGAAANRLGYNIRTGRGYSLTKDGLRLLQSVFTGSESSLRCKSAGYYLHIARRIEDIFPRGIKEGTGCSWRGTRQLVADKLRMAEQKSGVAFTENEAVRAADEYVSSFTDRTYMRTLPYFIFKATVDGEGCLDWQSDLITIIEKNRDENNSRRKGLSQAKTHVA